MQKLRMGYVGCGFMAQKVHIPNLLSLPDVDLVAIAEVRPELGRRVQERYHIPKRFLSHLELAQDPDIQAVGLSGHYAVQGEIAIDLLRAGKDVFMEKPMAVSLEQADRILQAERESGHRVMVGYMKRYDRGNLLVKAEVSRLRESGELGKLRYVRNHCFCGDWIEGLDTPFEVTDEPYPPARSVLPSWMPASVYERYVLYLQQYTHNVNLIRWLLDADRMRVKTVDLDQQDGLSGVVLFDVEGIRAIVESGQIAYHAWEEHTTLYFERGWIRTEAPALLLRNVPAHVEVYRADGTYTRSEIFPANGWAWSYKEELKHFVSAVLSGTPFGSSAEDAHKDVQLMEEIYRLFSNDVSV